MQVGLGEFGVEQEADSAPGAPQARGWRAAPPPVAAASSEEALFSAFGIPAPGD